MADSASNIINIDGHDKLDKNSTSAHNDLLTACDSKTKKDSGETNVSSSLETNDSVVSGNKTVYPTLRWGQDKNRIFIMASCTKPIKNSAKSLGTQDMCQFIQDKTKSTNEADTLKINFVEQAVTLHLYANYCAEGSVAKLLDNGQLSITLLKTKRGVWPRLCETTKKLHFLSIDWSRWEDEDDTDLEGSPDHKLNKSLARLNLNSVNKKTLNDSTKNNEDMAPSSVILPDGNQAYIPPLTPFGDSSVDGGIVEIHGEDCRTLEDIHIPLLEHILNDQESISVENVWTETLTMAQRLHTLTRMWNIIPNIERATVLQTLVKLMTDINQSIASDIKGGQEVLRDLMTDEYAERHVTFLIPWVNQLKNMSPENRLTVLAKLFSLGTDFEKRVICSTFL